MQEYVNILTWDSNPLSMQDIERYRIYQFEENTRTLLIELNSDTYEYYHRGVDEDKKYYYGLVGVDSKGKEGTFTYASVE